MVGRANGSPEDLELAIMGAALLFPLVGLIVVARRPDHLVGWLFGAIGVLWTTGTLAAGYSTYAVVTEPGALGGWLAAWYGEWFWIVFWFLTLVVTPMVFPTGHSLSRRWGVVLRSSLAVAAVCTVIAAMDPALEILGTKIEVDNPLGTALGADPDDTALGLIMFPLMLGSAAGAATSLVLRFRRSRGDERQQLKWFTFAAVILVFLFLVNAVVEDTLNALFVAALALVPTAAGIAILKYRLYDIDVLINRTLVYGGLTAVLGGLYLASVVALQLILRPVTSDSDLAVAASTLAVAGLFRPVRARVQALIDRRFYRRKYDAARSLERISARLRDEVDLDAVSGDVMGALAETMQPSHASLWLVARS
jgi:hypothetical protein